ncbi:Alpha/Beta hydrolase protein [Schizophyllum amplum]|uniref:Alpha/Beta hydrolase protein n=1 Tax=Schizophyllum amplum TaxID=97359 RepID=A0A550CRP0_9AGAR|nr:Alpha/Beta hydrolase protein [Auriculariopsis ampla]
MSSLAQETFTLDLRPAYRLLVAAKRYRANDAQPNPDALTLLFVHSTHTCKEYWEPTIDDLVTHVSAASRRRIHDIWAVDAPYHGDTALLNEGRPEADETGPFEEWEHWLRAVLNCEALRHRRVVLIGHSMGAAVLPLAFIREPRPHNVAALILVEPIALKGLDNFEQYANILPEGARRRGTRFESFERALAHFEALPSWKGYDERIIKKFVDHSFRPLPEGGVASKCTLEREIECYNDPQGLLRVYQALPRAAQAVPMHLIMAEGNRFMGRAFKDDIINVVAGPGRPATVSFIADAEHVVVQQKPREVAIHILDVLQALLSGMAKL